MNRQGTRLINLEGSLDIDRLGLAGRGIAAAYDAVGTTAERALELPVLSRLEVDCHNVDSHRRKNGCVVACCDALLPLLDMQLELVITASVQVGAD